jgi:hypothetical protein
MVFESVLESTRQWKEWNRREVTRGSRAPTSGYAVTVSACMHGALCVLFFAEESPRRGHEDNQL